MVRLRCKCGHAETIQIYGKVSGRDNQAAYEQTKLCYECYKAEQSAKRAAESHNAAEAAKSSGLPALVGSDKQIAWAETIRAAALAEIEPLRETMEKVPQDHPNIKSAKSALEIINKVAGRASAKDWIDTRATAYDRAWLSAETKKAMET